MESFIDTDTITDDEELLRALKHNNKVSSNMKQKIKEMEKLDEANKNMIFKKERHYFEEDEYEYEEEQDEDSDYLYYYEPINDVSEDISEEELEHIIKENLPSKNNPNYFKIISRMMAEIFKEIMEYEEIKSDSIGEEEIIEETQKLIDLNKRKINFIRNAKEKETNEEEIKDTIYLGIRNDKEVAYINRDALVGDTVSNISRLNISYKYGKITKISWSYDFE